MSEEQDKNEQTNPSGQGPSEDKSQQTTDTEPKEVAPMHVGEETSMARFSVKGWTPPQIGENIHVTKDAEEKKQSRHLKRLCVRTLRFHQSGNCL